MKSHTHMVGGLSLADWDQQWIAVEGGLQVKQPQLRRQIGLYRFLDDGEVKALGVAIGLPGGLEKRLHDFWRAGESGRRYRAGRLVYELRARLKTQVLIVGPDIEARRLAQELKYPMVDRHDPVWTIRRTRFKHRA